MPLPQVIEGTSEEIVTLLQGDPFVGRRMRIVVELEEEAVSECPGKPPGTIRDARHLEELLLQGLASPSRDMTAADWDELYRRAQERIRHKVS